ncbi:flavodoxin family protein [Oleiagrimonas sp. C23AA]|uniref:flavodoxin family protein n=1 Tax=Oleiagrimonas sp. C23AA TaxID=2719047 RepID=UPI00141E4E55|nr:flavodoxin family protein [Oleiagrimonas sp. C23AA]NII09735.1 flavodoxin family protein [Oleiagrimonas sp. C23AA]
MANIALVYYSGYGHTAKLAKAVEEGALSVENTVVHVLRIDDEGQLPDGAWKRLADADAVIYGSPTYMGGPAWQFKRFADTSSRPWQDLAWKDKLAAGFTNSGALNGDKFSTLTYLFTLSQQHGQIWIGTGLPAANYKRNGPNDLNWTGGFSGAMAISPVDASPEEAPRKGDLDTARHLGKRVAQFAGRIAL